jgi:hypothetical protein
VQSILDQLSELSQVQYEREISRVWDLACARPSGVRTIAPARVRSTGSDPRFA